MGLLTLAKVLKSGITQPMFVDSYSGICLILFIGNNKTRHHYALHTHTCSYIAIYIHHIFIIVTIYNGVMASYISMHS